MVDLVLVHVNERQAEQEGDLILETIDEFIKGGSKVYNLPDELEPAAILEKYNNHFIEIPYRGDEKDIFIQFFDFKLRLLVDNVNYIAISGQDREWCIPSVERLMKGELNFHPPDANQLGWSQELYQTVLDAKIPYAILDDLVM